jgi:hypothetical protein
MRLLRAETLVQLGAPSPRRGSLLSPVAIVRPGEYVSDVTSSPSATRPELSSREGRTPEPVQHQRLLRVDLAARARECSGPRLHEVSALWIRLRSHHVATFGVSDLLRGPSFDLAADRVPARSYRRSLPTTSLVSGRSRRARSPPPRVSLPRRRPTFSRWGSGRAWVRPGGDPGPLDRCLQLTDFVFKDDRLTSRHTSHRLFPHDARARGFTPQRPLRRAVGRRQGVVSLGFRSRRRTSDAPSPAGSPGGTMSTGVGPRSACDLRSKPVGLGPLHQAA